MLGTNAPMRIAAAGRITVGASAVAGDDVACHGVIIKALCSGQQIHVGRTSAVTAASGGFQLDDLESLNLEVRNLKELYFIASAAGQVVTYLAYVTN